ncbi:hypothetical protein SH139x_000008 [Planctomycetaceae bacterium SH139]
MRLTTNRTEHPADKDFNCRLGLKVCAERQEFSKNCVKWLATAQSFRAKGRRQPKIPAAGPTRAKLAGPVPARSVRQRDLSLSGSCAVCGSVRLLHKDGLLAVPLAPHFARQQIAADS